MSRRSFRPHVPDEVLLDLEARLARARWPDEVEGAGWRHGVPRAVLEPLVARWRDGFDWRARERAWIDLPHERVELDGLGIHVLRFPGRGPAPLPLVVTHGWPGSFLEMLRLGPLLADPEPHGGDPRDAFDVVVPSLPGYGFSDRPTARGWSRPAIAELWHRLMLALGFARYGAHGGDIGASVTSRLGLGHPDALVGIHVSSCLAPWLGPGSPPLSAAERAFQTTYERWYEEEGGYMHQQRTRPLTLAYALNDSPVGLLAWIVEKFRAWSDCGGDVLARFEPDFLLENATLYWATGTIGSSLRLYSDAREDPAPLGPDERVRVPTGVCLTVEPVDRAPREWAERVYDVRRYTALPRGGHFLALEEPELLADDLRAFFRPLRG